MAARDRRQVKRLIAALLTGVSLSSVMLAKHQAFAQEKTARSAGPPAIMAPNIPDDAKLQLAANELVYNKDAQKVSAVGGVQINYGGYQMVAKRVEYDQKTGRMMAYGNIELIEPGGNRVYADKLDVTDDFANGFIESLRVETNDNTRLAAQRGERIDTDQMILYKGVYTACLPCVEKGRSPLWQIKAERIVQNGKTKTIRLEKARFQLFGQTIASIPAIEVPDNTVKRKSGFLFPTFSTTEKLGFGAVIPYYWAISPQTDATIKVGGYTSQGVLVDGELRHQFEDGLATVRLAGINQFNKSRFDAGTSDAEKEFRGLFATTGKFEINPRWTFGWDGMIQTDNNFAKTYDLEGLNQQTHTNQIYLTGLGDRNFFDLRSYYFDVQDADPGNKAERQQAIVTPALDYSYYAPEPFLGGELSAVVNFTALSRSNSDIFDLDPTTFNTRNRFVGLKGNYSRLTAEMEWKRSFTTDEGLVLTPILAARGDVFGNNMQAPAPGTYSGNFDDGTSAARGMVTAGLEARYPWLITTQNSSHTIEPIAQVFLRPDEQMAGRLPNEDAQSFVFDATNLFERDKFSGFDRVEGGTRANVGLRYTGSFDNGYSLRSIVGQSYQLAGKNSFASSDLVYAGNESGLETRVSDYVSMVGIDTPFGVNAAANARFDEKTFELRRTDTSLGYHNDSFQTAIIYSQIAAQPNYGFPVDREEVQNSSSVKIGDFWSVFGSVTYDVKKNNINRYGLGISYDDECTIFSIVYKEQRDPDNQTANDWSIGARITFRTLGDIKVGDTDVASFN